MILERFKLFNLSPEKISECTKKMRGENPSLEIFHEMLRKLERQILEQVTVKKDTKESMTNVSKYFAKLKPVLTQQLTAAKTAPVDESAMELQVYRNKVANAKLIEEVNAICQEKWPKGCFLNTKLHRGKKFEDENTLYSILLYPDGINEDKNFIRLKENIPAVGAISDQLVKEKVYIPICQEAATVIEGVDELPKKKRIEVIIAGAVISERGALLETADLMNWADKLKEHAQANNKHVVHIAFPSDDQVDKIRKVFECRLAGSTITAHLLIYDRHKGPANDSNEEYITVEGGASYAEMLKTVKEGVSPSEMGILVKKVHKTQSGALRLVVKETTTGAKNKLLDKISEVLPANASVRNVQQTKGIVISNIEDDIEELEIKETLSSQLEISTSDIKCTAFRYFQRGGKSITIFLPKLAAEKAILSKYIKLGWTT